MHTQVEEVRDQAACLLCERAQLAPPRGDLRRRLFAGQTRSALLATDGAFKWSRPPRGRSTRVGSTAAEVGYVLVKIASFISEMFPDKITKRSAMFQCGK